MAIDLQRMVQAGYALHAQGRVAEALPFYRRVLIAVPTVGLVHSLLATATGRSADAARAVVAEPGKASSRLTLANALSAEDRLHKAREQYRFALHLDPANAGTANDWANAEAQRSGGDRSRAGRLYRRALCLDPGVPATWFNFGGVERDGDGLEHDRQGEHSYRRAAVLSPGAPDIRFNHASALSRLRRWDDAKTAFRRVLILDPCWPDAWPRYVRLIEDEKGRAEWANRTLGATPRSSILWLYRADGYRVDGKQEQADSAYRRSFVLDPAVAGSGYGRYATVLRALDLTEKVDRNHDRAVIVDPLAALSRWHRANILFQNLQLGPARETFRRALVVTPAMSGCWQNLGTTLNRFAEIEGAEVAYTRAAVLATEDAAVVRSALLMVTQYRPGITAADLHRLHQKWTVSAFGSPEELPRPPRSGSRCPLRVGFLSPDLGQHPVGFFLQAFMEQLDRNRITAHLMSTYTRQDPIAAWLASYADDWRDLSHLDPDAMLSDLRARDFDVLIDLAGHSARNTMPVFARRAARVQITWGGYVGTTGLDAMDWLITDRYQTKPGTEESYSERWLTLPHDYICYRPSPDAPEVGPLPALTNGSITFGSFNNTSKINHHVLDIWGKLLSVVPGSRLLLSYNGLDDPQMQGRILRSLARHGAGADRVTFRVGLDHRDYLSGYNQVDIGLDTFPYSGGLTTCEALWMGVPVVTIPGDTFAGRHSLSHLSNAGITGTVARDTEDYLRIAADLAAEPDRLAAWRSRMRAEVAASPLCDGPTYAETFTQAMERAVSAAT